MNGKICSKGYFYIFVYYKVHKRVYGNRWRTTFVLLSREEVTRLQRIQLFPNPDSHKATQSEDKRLD